MSCVIGPANLHRAHPLRSRDVTHDVAMVGRIGGYTVLTQSEIVPGYSEAVLCSSYFNHISKNRFVKVRAVQVSLWVGVRV